MFKRQWTRFVLFVMSVVAFFRSLPARVRQMSVVKLLRTGWSWIVWAGTSVVFIAAWLTAQVFRVCTDVHNRKQICEAVMAQASQAVARSITLKIVYTAATVYMVYRGWFIPAVSLVIVLGMASVVWHFVLYVSALVSKMDADLMATVEATKEVAAQLGRKAESAVAQKAVPVPVTVN